MICFNTKSVSKRKLAINKCQNYFLSYKNTPIKNLSLQKVTEPSSQWTQISLLQEMKWGRTIADLEKEDNDQQTEH